MCSISHEKLISFVLKKRVASFTPSGMFIVKYVFGLVYSTSSISFLCAKFIWQSKAKFKIKDLCLLVVNTNQGEKTSHRLGFDCIVCVKTGELISHHFSFFLTISILNIISAHEA